MCRRFNITGTCIPEKHYMADISGKLEQIMQLIHQDAYFMINRARQYGKTTTLVMLWKQLKESYITINISFEGLGTEAFRSEDAFVRRFCTRVSGSLRLSGYHGPLFRLWDTFSEEENLDTLKERILLFCGQAAQEVLLFIDEVDKSSDNQMFLNFLGLLRELYLERAMGAVTFKSVILAGVYDVKNLKLRLRPDEERKYNSPWNIAADFFVDMSLSVSEIETMLRQYRSEKQTDMNCDILAEEIYRYTSGYPYLVSLICLWMDERLPKSAGPWTVEGVRTAVREILKSTNTLFDDVIKNIENHIKFRQFIEGILLEGNQIPYKRSNPEIDLGVTCGLISEKDGICGISNIIFETYIYDHLIAGKLTEQRVLSVPRDQFFTSDGALNMGIVLKKFQDFMKAEYRKRDEAFMERQGRLLFLTFIKPIINGSGHYVVEPETRDNTKMDIVIFYGEKEYILELKLWHGPKRFIDSLDQLARYMDSRGQSEGWLLIFSFLTDREKKMEDYTEEVITADGKKIYSFLV
ncbi:MAG: AAA family ATPase [Lachnospiraceae bacterium]|nr:AAA family ATPase [Lachnospiraceae bacterium]